MLTKRTSRPDVGLVRRRISLRANPNATQMRTDVQSNLKTEPQPTERTWTSPDAARMWLRRHPQPGLKVKFFPNEAIFRLVPDTSDIPEAGAEFFAEAKLVLPNDDRSLPVVIEASVESKPPPALLTATEATDVIDSSGQPPDISTGALLPIEPEDRDGPDTIQSVIPDPVASGGDLPDFAKAPTCHPHPEPMPPRPPSSGPKRASRPCRSIRRTACSAEAPV
jgi:hypothetical protein